MAARGAALEVERQTSLAGIGWAPGKLLVGNWKMHGLRAQLAEVAAIDREAAGANVVLCLPATLIAAAAEQSRHARIGAQDCHAGDQGAYTGMLSAPMLADAGARWVILGHSESRSAGVSDQQVIERVAAATPVLMPIVCVGEAARGEGPGPVLRQLHASLGDVADPVRLVIAYEPIWAIGSGVIPSPAEIAATHEALRRELIVLFGRAGESVPILYGGSVNASNAGAVLALESVGGLLVGGASLVAASFLPILGQVRAQAASG